ncbi:MAG: Maf family protein [Pseudomonadota bacterium]
MELVLASASPRRRQLLSQLRTEFSCQPSAIEEQRQTGESASDYVQRLALDKAIAVVGKQTELSIVIGSDTLIDYNGSVLEKPNDKDHFLTMMMQLSGQQHIVRTSVALVAGSGHQILQQAVVEVVTEIYFGEVSLAEAEAYWATGEPVDKAGGYAIQGQAARFVKAINGSYTGVVGLPLYETERLLTWIENELRSHDGC